MLALDYGSARCGCALSDPTGTLATPIEPVLAAGTRRGLSAIARLVADREVGHVVVGLPVSLSGADSEQTRETLAFARRLKRRLGPKIGVEFHDERYTTRIAGRTAGASMSEDSRAAAVLLESWLAAGDRPGSA